MRCIWLLPDRTQTGCIRALEGGTIHNLHEHIDLSVLPPELILGIPEELFRTKLELNFLFGQFTILNSGERIFCISAPAGRDISGRIVSISNLQILGEKEEPTLKFSVPSNISNEDREIITENFASQNENYLKKLDPIKKMLNAVMLEKKTRSFSSETLISASNKPEWMPQKKKPYQDGVISKKNITLLIFLIAIAVLFYLRF
ncbi:hypothetical protein TH59_08215 [Pantoea ananatis]|jgi:hypothetical protein|uniref:hypothetical protein n=1 Tax=Pantoea ananas TaxID=553 RepID=UPI000CF4D8AE|nr:hypothetical protein [Pantoea ananatis]MBC6558563.1 hypothetical protein [Citrobacter braakii]MCV3297510.1 hypothetical protein [Pantoea ananatis]MDC7865189.1 hypothetical protein [Pantoea ananatis]PQK75171.1 hypothetical protein CG430_14355 [Pantoea ananatis]